MEKNNQGKEILKLLQENYNIESAQDLSSALKDMFKGALQEMMNAEELARRLNKHINTIYNWIKKGMPCIKTEKDYLINYDEVIEWLKSRDKRGE